MRMNGYKAGLRRRDSQNRNERCAAVVPVAYDRRAEKRRRQGVRSKERKNPHLAQGGESEASGRREHALRGSSNSEAEEEKSSAGKTDWEEDQDRVARPCEMTARKKIL